MINKALFIEMIEYAEAFEAEADRWHNFGIQVYDMPIVDIPWGMFNCWLEGNFDIEGKDWVNWYLWERRSFSTNEVLPCYHKDGTQFFVNTAEDLWDLVKDHRLKSCLDSPCNFSGIEQCTGL